MSLSVWVASCSERHVREANQDRVYPAPQPAPVCFSLPAILAVADGMGGTEGGEQAAEIATSFVEPFARSLSAPEGPLPANWSAFARPLKPKEEPSAQWLEQYFRFVNHTIVRQLGGAGVAGSTLSLLRLEEKRWALGHLGDTRVYLFRDGRLHRLTTDHNLFQRALEDGYLLVEPDALSLSPEDKEWLQEQESEEAEFFYVPQTGEDTSPLRSAEGMSDHLRGQFAAFVYNGRLQPVGRSRERLVYALGKESEIPPARVHPAPPAGLPPTLSSGDLFLLCSDGLCGVVKEQALAARLQQLEALLRESKGDPSRLMWGVEMLLQDAIEADSNDNVSIVLAWVTSNAGDSVGRSEARSAQPKATPASDRREEASRKSTWEVGRHVPVERETPSEGLRSVPVRTQPAQVRSQPVSARVAQGSPAQPETLRHRERLFWILLLLLALGGWWWQRTQATHVKPHTGTPARAKVPLDSKGSVPVLLWSLGPDFAKDKGASARRQLLQRWNLLLGALQREWGLLDSGLGKQRRLLAQRPLRARAWKALSKTYSKDENRRFVSLDAALRRALQGWTELLVPDAHSGQWSLWKKPPLPLPGALSSERERATRLRRRKTLLRLQTESQPLLGPHWRLEWSLLLVEMPVAHAKKTGRGKKPQRPDAATRLRFLRRCKGVLALINKQAPKSSVRSLLENWVQLLQDK